MKTNLLFTIAINLITGCILAQNTVLNGNFESWTPVVFEDPQNFNLSSNRDAFYENTAVNLTKTTDAQSGNFAVKLTTIAGQTAYFGHKSVPNMNPTTWVGGIAYNQSPTALTGYYKANIVPGDKAIIMVYFSVGTTHLGVYSLDITDSQSVYTYFTIPIPPLSQTPDAVNVLATSSDVLGGTPISGNMLQLDNLVFTGVTSQPALMNGNFEQWVTYTNHRPNNWQTLRAELVQNGNIRSTDAYEGSYAIELKSFIEDNNGTPRNYPAEVSTGYWDNNCNCTMGGYPYTLQNGTFAFHYKYTASVPADRGRYHLIFKKNGNQIGYYGQDLVPVSTYQMVSIPFNLPQVPDTVIISFESTNWNNSSVTYAGSKLLIDNVRLFQPANDLVSFAKTVANNTYTDFGIDPQNANAEGGNMMGICNTGNYKTVFYKFHATSASVVTATIANPQWPSAIIFFEAPHLNVTLDSQLTYINTPLNHCGVNVNSSSITATTGKFYYIALINGGTTNFTVNWVNSPPDCTPPNDLISNAITASNATYTHNDINPQCGNPEMGDFIGCGLGTTIRTVFYKFGAVSSSTVTATISNPIWPNAVVFFEAPNLNVTSENQLTYVNVPSNPCSVANATSSILTVAGKNYYVVFTNGGTSNLSINNINSTMSLEELTINKVKVYPNPSKGIFNFESVGEISKIEIFNVLGQKLQTVMGLQTVDIGLQAKGVYYYKVEHSDNTFATGRIIVD